MSRTYVSALLRRLVHQRAQGCCEYCRIPERVSFVPHQIDHIIAEKHGGPTTADNLALSCVLCNKHKGSDLASIAPSSGEIVPLFNPRRDDWSGHFLIENNGRLRPLTSSAEATIQLLQLNSAERLEERRLMLAAGLLS